MKAYLYKLYKLKNSEELNARLQKYISYLNKENHQRKPNVFFTSPGAKHIECHHLLGD